MHERMQMDVAGIRKAGDGSFYGSAEVQNAI